MPGGGRGCKQMVLLSGSQWRLNQGRAQGNPPQSAQIPACSMPGAAKEQEGRIPGLHPGSWLVHPHSPPAPRACTLQAEQAPALEYFKAVFFFFRKKELKSNSSCGGILPKCQHNLCYITGKCDNLNAWLLNVSGTEV